MMYAQVKTIEQAIEATREELAQMLKKSAREEGEQVVERLKTLCRVRGEVK